MSAKSKEKNPNGKKKRPDIGVGVLVINQNGHILLSKRLKPYGFGKLALPGGHVEWMETLVQTAKREVLEETGIKLGKCEEMRDYTEELNRKMDKHYATFYLIAAMPKGQKPKDMEPHKHGPWGWYDPFNLPRHAWNPTKRLIKRSGHLITAFINRIKYPPKKIAPATMKRIYSSALEMDADYN
jgi:8-oxo-dGTP diphosphatase